MTVPKTDDELDMTVYHSRLLKMNEKPWKRRLHPREWPFRTQPIRMTSLRYNPTTNPLKYLSYKKISRPSLQETVVNRIRPTLDSLGRSKFFYTRLPQFKKTLEQKKDGYYYDCAGRLLAFIGRNELDKYVADKEEEKKRERHYVFKTFLSDFDTVLGKNQMEPKFLVVSSCPLFAYPTILPLAITYGLEVLEPHYLFTSFLEQDKTPIWLLRSKKVYKYASKNIYMDTKMFESILRARLQDHTKLFRGFVLSGLGHVFLNGTDRGYTLLRSILSNHYRPDRIVYVRMPEYMNVQRLMAYEPSANFTLLLYNFTDYIKFNLAPKYYQGRILPEDVIPPPKNTPFFFSIENGVIRYVTLLEWKEIMPKVSWVWKNRLAVQVDEEWVEFHTLPGMAPDPIQLFPDEEYNRYNDLASYVYESFYLDFFASSYPTINFDIKEQEVELKDIVEWTKIQPIVPRYFPFIKINLTYLNSERQDLMKGDDEDRKEWQIKIPWGRDAKRKKSRKPKERLYHHYRLRRSYWLLHVGDALPNRTLLSRLASMGVKTIDDKLNAKEIEGRILYFKNVKKLPPHMQALEGTDVGTDNKIDPVTTMQSAVLTRGHYAHRFRYDTDIIYTRSKYAIYQFLSNSTYRKLQWAWQTKVHLLVSGQPVCGAKYVGSVLAMVFKTPHIYFDSIYKSALAIKRSHSYAMYLESCWMGIWFYKWNVYTAIEEERFKRFLPWAISRVKEIRKMACKGMDEFSIYQTMKYRCYYPYFRLSRAEEIEIFPRLKFECPDLEPKYIRWEEEILEGFVRVLDFIMLSVLNLECPPLFLARLLYDAPSNLLPNTFEIEKPAEMFVSASILHEFYFREKEVLSAEEEVNLLNGSIYHAMANCGNLIGDGWVVSGVKVYPEFCQKLEKDSGVKTKIIYLMDSSYYIIQSMYAQDLVKPTTDLARQVALTARTVKPSRFPQHDRFLRQLSLLRKKPAKYEICRAQDRSSDSKTINSGVPYKCKCHDYLLAHTYFETCTGIALPLAMRSSVLSMDEEFAPSWAILKNTVFYNQTDAIKCQIDPPNLNYDDNLPFRFIPMKRPNWKRIFCRRYAYDYFFKQSYMKSMTNSYVEFERKHILPNKFAAMVSTMIQENKYEKPLACNCTVLCLCKPVENQDYASRDCAKTAANAKNVVFFK